MTVSEFINVNYFCNVELSYEKSEYEHEDYNLVLCGDTNKPVYKRFGNAVVKEIYPTDGGNVALTVFFPQ